MCSAFFSHEIFHIYTCFRKLLLSSLPYIIPSLWNWVCPWPFTLKPAKEDVKGEEKREEEMSFKEIRQCCFKKTCSVYCILWLRGRHDMWMHTEIGWGKQSSPKEKRGSPCRGNTRLSQSKAALNDQLQPGSECPPGAQRILKRSHWSWGEPRAAGCPGGHLSMQCQAESVTPLGSACLPPTHLHSTKLTRSAKVIFYNTE